MPTKKLIPVLAASLVVALAASAQEREMSARDVFREAKDMFDFQQKSTPAKKPARKPARKPVTPPKPPTPPKEVVKNDPPPARPADPPITSSNEPQVLNAALVDQPLGLRYSILKKSASGDVVEIDSESVFQSGDSIRITVESSDIAYLYIVNKGSSGRWNVLFPSKGIAGGANRVEPDYRYVIPPGGWFTFDEQVGEEDLFILLSRTPVDDLEKEIYELSGDDDGPAAGPADKPKVMMASASPVADSTIDGYRKVYSRDLVFEKVDDEAVASPAVLQGDAKPEKAVYVVTKSGGRDARVVADLKLVHQ